MFYCLFSGKLTSSETAFFSADERLKNDRFAGLIRCISFQWGSDGNIFLPFFNFDMALRIYDARRPSNSKCTALLSCGIF